MTSDNNTDIPFSRNNRLGEEQDNEQLTISSTSDEDTSGVTIKQSPGTIPSSSAKKDTASSVDIKRSVKKVGGSNKGGWAVKKVGGSSKGGWATSWATRRPPQGRTWSERLKPRHDGPGAAKERIAEAKRARVKISREQWAKEKVAIVQMVMGDSTGADVMGDRSMHYYREKLYLHNNGQINTERHAREKLVVGDCKGADELCGRV